ncbi:hypothetical protein BJ878DRAFT_177841 [Calycina marina]|uniref:Protein SQS1 n=1 Tax=Calycina marina TaxID=1763456 RepID=A0A9P7Z911_9HELO|nr:hypothetical protein BJ878DRAFT_177841 [Calycina marina]
MPRAKKYPQRGGKAGHGARGGSGRGRGSGYSTSALVPFVGAGNHNKSRDGGQHTLSLQDEARNTAGRTQWGDSNVKLRNMKIKFVSAGAYDPPNLREALESMTLKSSPAQEAIDRFEATVDNDLGGLAEDRIEVTIEEDEDEETEEAEIQVLVDEEDEKDEEDSASFQGFVIDTTGGERVHTKLTIPKLRSPSPTPSNSSEEIIVFGGRNKYAPTPAPKKTAPTTVIDPIDVKIQRVEEEIHHQEQLLEETIHEKDHPEPYIEKSVRRVQETQYHEECPSDRLPQSEDMSDIQPGKRRRRTRKKKKTSSNQDDVLMADYIANMDSPEEFLGPFNQRELGGSDEAWQETGDSSEEPILEEQMSGGRQQSMDGWERSDMVDFDDLSTDDGLVGEIAAIYSKRERPIGVQYLVVYKNHSVDEAKWVTPATIAFCCAQKLIDEFEVEEKLLEQFNTLENTDSDDDQLGYDIDHEIKYDVDDSFDDDQKVADERMEERMADEQIARLLSKQEELGMGSDKLMLFDDAADDEDDRFVGFKKVTRPTRCKGKGKAKSQTIHRAKGDFSTVSASADAYDGFDVMDFERPSLQKKPKGRKGKMIFGLSDSELEEPRRMAWDNDRRRKKEKKEEREELRSQGLLGSKNGKIEMKVKYKEGMSFNHIKAEFKNFLMGNDETLAFPPMDKADRKVVHEIANVFNLKSKSVGGAKRFPVLYKTSKTGAYNASMYEQVEAQSVRRFLPNRATGGGGGKKAGGGQFNSAAVAYRDGDIVGGSAPEIGAENRGRAMLEKMGWSSGTALGALNNKGIMTPVTHVVKNSKAGLG